MSQTECPTCEFEMKNIKDLFRQIEKQVEYCEIFWCPYCGALQDLDAVDCRVDKPLIYTPKEARLSILK